jgi:TfoX/Sxy family transcriptional regulator of competence genes
MLIEKNAKNLYVISIEMRKHKDECLIDIFDAYKMFGELKLFHDETFAGALEEEQTFVKEIER